METEWQIVSEALQRHLDRMAMSRAAELVAVQAETLADAMESGRLAGFSGSDALRLFVSEMRAAEHCGRQDLACA